MDTKIIVILYLQFISLSKASVEEAHENVESQFFVSQLKLSNQLPSPESPSLSVSSFFVHISQLPRRVFDKSLVTVTARCPSKHRIILELTISTEAVKEIAAFRGSALCQKDVEEESISMPLKLPRYLAYRPDHHNKYSIFVDKAAIRTWLSPLQNGTDFKRSKWSDEIYVNVPRPFDLPPRPMLICPTWINEILWRLSYRPTCKLELEILHAVKFPLALSGFNTGVHRAVPDYHSLGLQRIRLASFKKPRFTFVMWLFVTDYCPSGGERCSVLQHLIWNDNYASPRIHLNQKGQLIIEIVLENGQALEVISNSNQIIPKFKWTKLVFSCTHVQCEIYVDYGTRIWRHLLIFSPDDILYFDDVTGVFVFGGSELQPSFQGYIGQAAYYRRKIVSPEMIERPKSDHPMFELGLNKREDRCNVYTQQVNHVIYQTRSLLEAIIQKKTCRNNATRVFFPKMTATSVNNSQCLIYNSPRTSSYGFVFDLVRKWVLEGKHIRIEEIGLKLMNKAESIMRTEHISSMPNIVSFLKQGSCYGNHEATFMLSNILNYGVTVKAQELISHSYLMYGALDGNRLCLLSLGNKHFFGLDGFTRDHEQAYVYYKSVADMTKSDLDRHNDEDVLTEIVRLTNRYDLHEQTQEDGDVFAYIKHQADQGVLSAQQNLARMYYWGSRGIERDLVAAMRYYKMAAESGDPSAVYDYSIVLLKGHGTAKNLNESRRMLKMAALKNFPQALNTLGWFALEIDKNYTEAAHFFHLAHKLESKDASYNLGHMYFNGIYPNSSVDKIKAWEYFATGALRGHFESAIIVAMYNMRGHPKIIRDPTLALGWVRFVAEKNPGIGKILSRGVNAFKKEHWSSSLIYYLMAASTGLEVANFNLAFLCEENYDGLVAYFEKDCKWKHFNISAIRAGKSAETYAWIKLGDFHLTGVGGKKKIDEAARYYSDAAIYGDAQGFYNLATMLEDSEIINSKIWKKLSIPISIQNHNVSLLIYLYTRCKDMTDNGAFVPCSISLLRVQIQYFWKRFHLWLLSTVFIGFGIVVLVGASSILSHFINHRQDY